ncbi:MAG: hypothetical protein WCS98_07280 [Bacillota bacterium]|jgi:hypothetical protein|nr:hypothetical protein [Bacillota bacterium]MDD3297896.1 hypothetical protein [Bacillota bacterium]MDD3851962.1 hypothetical protein [Bacillota bacterium]MDD4707699.1 hypothetical protein [Bacillota bacterium]
MKKEISVKVNGEVRTGYKPTIDTIEEAAMGGEWKKNGDICIYTSAQSLFAVRN